MTVQCCKCKRIREGGGWIHAAEGASVLRQVTHGYCPACAADAFKEIRAWQRETSGEAQQKAVVNL